MDYLGESPGYRKFNLLLGSCAEGKFTGWEIKANFDLFRNKYIESKCYPHHLCNCQFVGRCCREIGDKEGKESGLHCLYFECVIFSWVTSFLDWVSGKFVLFPGVCVLMIALWFVEMSQPSLSFQHWLFLCGGNACFIFPMCYNYNSKVNSRFCTPQVCFT